MFKRLFSLIFLTLFLLELPLTAQIPSLGVNDINPTLIENANSVVRLNKEIINIPNRSTVQIEKTRIVTVLNKKGDEHVKAYSHYDAVTRVKDIKASVYDKYGTELKSFNRRDFEDVAAIDGISLFTDSRIMYLDYTPTSYPYTVVFKVKTASDNTAFLPRFYANTDYFSSTEKGYFKINADPSLGLRVKQLGPENTITSLKKNNDLLYEVQNVAALIPEAFSPGFENIVSKALFSLDYFHLEGVDGEATSWKSFGHWMYNALLSGTEQVPEETAQEVKTLVQGVESVSERARLVYEYMQNRTRYISVQVGIGGWKPMLASDVDNLGYGDCKALSNYTKSLLDIADVPSYYTIVYGDSAKRDIQKDFPSVQGNHAILAVPDNNDYIWLECTNQNVPFGYISGFTDDRDVLIITPEGGEIVHTKRYAIQENTLKGSGEVELNTDGSIFASYNGTAQGSQYNSRYLLPSSNEKDKEAYYQDYWSYHNTLEIEEIRLNNLKLEKTFIEDLKFKVGDYAVFAGEEILFQPNVFNRFNFVPKRYTTRSQNVILSNGFIDEDTINITIPNEFQLSYIPEPVSASSAFGVYTAQIDQVSDNTFSYSRKFTLNDGEFPKESYASFRKFLKKINKLDQLKIILTYK